MVVYPEPVDPDEETRVSSVSRIIGESRTADSCLVTIYGPDLGRQFKLLPQATSIGRGSENHIVFDMDNVSRRHARVQVDADGGFFVEDLNSTNGTYVNDVEVKTQQLRNGDLIKVGGAILKFLQGGNIEALFHEEIYRMAIVDGLTQVHNKRYLLEFLDREMARCARYLRPLSLIMFDVDHFKVINDSHGHIAGDVVLKRLAELVSEHVRKEEAFARYGGEEFAIIMPETPARRARVFAEKVRALVERTTFCYEGKSIAVTCSLGVAEMGDFADPAAFIAAADANLYAAKKAGRNQVVGGEQNCP